MNKEFSYQVEGKSYPVLITYKRIKNIHYKFNGEAFIVTAHRLTPFFLIKSGLDKHAKKLINRCVQTKAFGNGFIYVFGQKIAVSYPGEMSIDETTFSYKDETDLFKKLKKVFLSYVSDRTMFYEKEMGAPNFQVKVRQMKSRYGSNNKQSKTITYSTVLLPFSKEIIDSVIVHEIAHCFVYDHSDKFYKVVYKYSPRYDILRKKLIRSEFN